MVTPSRQRDHALSRSRGLEAIAPERSRVAAPAPLLSARSDLPVSGDGDDRSRGIARVSVGCSSDDTGARAAHAPAAVRWALDAAASHPAGRQLELRTHLCFDLCASRDIAGRAIIERLSRGRSSHLLRATLGATEICPKGLSRLARRQQVSGECYCSFGGRAARSDVMRGSGGAGAASCADRTSRTGGRGGGRVVEGSVRRRDHAGRRPADSRPAVHGP